MLSTVAITSGRPAGDVHLAHVERHGGLRAAAAMSMIQSENLNGQDLYRCLKDALERLPSLPASRIDKLLPPRWAQAHPLH